MTINPSDALERAIALAVKSHQGQRDKAGQPYVLHVLRVMHAVSDPIAKQAAGAARLHRRCRWNSRRIRASRD